MERQQANNWIDKELLRENMMGPNCVRILEDGGRGSVQAGDAFTGLRLWQGANVGELVDGGLDGVQGRVEFAPEFNLE